MEIMRSRIIICIIYTLWATKPVSADRGAIITQRADLQEPAQRAIVAHNGTWEVLILQTDVKADKPTEVVEFMPLPSTPEVSLVQDTCFENLQKIIDRYNLQYIVEFARHGVGDSSGKTEGVKVVAKHELGPHHVTVVKIEDVNEFESWVRSFFQDNSLEQPIFSNELKKTVEDYFQRNSHFFAFDVIEIPGGQKTVAPLAYQFKCDHVYYPLKVTNLYGGKGTVEIFYVLNPWRDPNAEGPDPLDFHNLSPQNKNAKYWICTRKVHVSSQELTSLYPAIGKLFRDAGAYLFATKLDGELQFDEDIWLNMGYDSSEFLCMRFLSLLQEQDFESLEFLLSVPFGLNREKTYDKTSETIGALKNFTKKHNLSEFRIKDRASMHNKRYQNEFDRLFIEECLKGRKWGYYILSSDEKALHFFIINQSRNPTGPGDYKVVNFRIASLDDYY